MEVCVDNIERLYKNYEILSGAADNILEVRLIMVFLQAAFCVQKRVDI